MNRIHKAIGGYLTKVGLLAATLAPVTPAVAQEEPPQIIEDMLREALGSERDTVENILKRLYPDRIKEIDDLVDKIEDEEEARVSESRFIEGWKGEGAIGADLSTGNVDEWGINGSLSIERDGLDWDHKFSLKIDVGELEGDRTDERITASYTGKRDIGESFYAFGSLSYERDRLQDIDRRFTETIGLGYKIIDKGPIDWTAEAGPALRQTRFRTQSNEDRLGIFGRTEFEWDITDTLDFKQIVTAIIDEGNSTFNSETAFTASIYGRLSARLSLELEHETDPPDGVEKTDTFTRGSIVYEF